MSCTITKINFKSLWRIFLYIPLNFGPWRITLSESLLRRNLMCTQIRTTDLLQEALDNLNSLQGYRVLPVAVAIAEPLAPVKLCYCCCHTPKGFLLLLKCWPAKLYRYPARKSANVERHSYHKKKNERKKEKVLNHITLCRILLKIAMAGQKWEWLRRKKEKRRMKE